jgi:uncharacterized membrane protein
VTLDAGESQTFSFWVTIPADAAADDTIAAVLTVTSTVNEGVSDSKTFTTTVIAQPMPDFVFDLTVSPSFILGEPGDVAEFVLSLSNMGTTADTYTISTESTWDLDVMGEVGPIAAGETVTFTASVTIPLTAEPGDRDTFVVTATSQGDTTVTDSVIFDVVYPDVNGVLISADPIAQTGYAGDDVQYEFTITNIGSMTDTFSLALALPEGVVSDFNEGPVTLGAGQSQTFSFSVTIPANAAADDTFAVVLTATSTVNEGVSDSKTFTTTVIAQPMPEFLIYLPMVFKAPVE